MSSSLNEACLFLNRNWAAICFLPVKTAIVTAMRDMACVVHPVTYAPMTFEDWSNVDPSEIPEESRRWIKTASRGILVPELVVLKKYGERPPMKIGLNRPNLWRRDEKNCQYCGEPLSLQEMTMDHVTPRARGGHTSWDNIVAACGDCNARKADHLPSEIGMRPKKKPTAPKWNAKMSVPKGPVKPTWVPFLKSEGIVG